MSKANIFVLIKTSSEDKDKRHLQDVFIKTNLRWVVTSLTYRSIRFVTQKVLLQCFCKARVACRTVIIKAWLYYSIAYYPAQEK